MTFFFIDSVRNDTQRRGSAIAKIVGRNAARLPNFNDRVTMYVYEEEINGKKLTEIINTTHENVKYLPGHKLPENVVSYNNSNYFNAHERNKSLISGWARGWNSSIFFDQSRLEKGQLWMKVSLEKD